MADEQQQAQPDPWSEQQKVNQQLLAGIQAVGQGLARMYQEQRQPAQQVAPPPPKLDEHQYTKANAEYVRKWAEDPLAMEAQKAQLLAQQLTQTAEQIAEQKAQAIRQEFTIAQAERDFFAANPDLQDPLAQSTLRGILTNPSVVNPNAGHMEKLQYAAQVTRSFLQQRDQWAAQMAGSQGQAAAGAAGIGGSPNPGAYQPPGAPEVVDELSERRAQVEAWKADKAARHEAANQAPMWRGRNGRR